MTGNKRQEGVRTAHSASTYQVAAGARPNSASCSKGGVGRDGAVTPHNGPRNPPLTLVASEARAPLYVRREGETL